MSDTQPIRINDQLDNLDNIDSSYDRRKAIDELDQAAKVLEAAAQRPGPIADELRADAEMLVIVSGLFYSMFLCDVPKAPIHREDFFRGRGWSVGVLIFDGFLLRKRDDESLSPELLRKREVAKRECKILNEMAPHPNIIGLVHIERSKIVGGF